MEIRKIEDSEDEFAGRLRRHSASPQTQLQEEKKMRREIANSNERRRMKSINEGFCSLRKSVPGADNEKLSKAALLTQTSEYIAGLVVERKRLINENYELQRMLSGETSPRPKRKKHDTESSEDDDSVYGQDRGERERLLREINDLRLQLEQEKRQRALLEEQTEVLRTGDNTPPLSAATAVPQFRVDPNKYTCKQRYMAEKQQRRRETEALTCALPSAPVGEEHQPDMSSLCRRNLDTIIAAIRQIEGDPASKLNSNNAINKQQTVVRHVTPSKTSETVVVNSAMSKATVAEMTASYQVGMRLFTPQYIAQKFVPRTGVIIQTSS